MWVDQKCLQCFGWKELDSRSPVWLESLAISWLSSSSTESVSTTFSIRFVFFYPYLGPPQNNDKEENPLDQIKVALNISSPLEKLANPLQNCIFSNGSGGIECVKMFGTSLLFQLIVMLCIIDSLFAGFSFLEYGLKKGLKLISYTTPIYVNLWPKFLYPLHNITNTLSLFVTLAIAVERYSFMLFKKCITSQCILPSQ